MLQRRGNKMNWIIDIGALLIIAVLAFWGFKQGLVKALIGLVGFVLALMLSLSLSGPVSELVYDNFISDTVKDSVSDYINSLTGETSSKTTSGMINGQTLYMSAPVQATAEFTYEDLLRQFQKNGGSTTENLTEEQKAQLAIQVQNGASVEEIVEDYNEKSGADVSVSEVAKTLGVAADTALNKVVQTTSDETGEVLGFDIGKIVKGLLGDALDADAISTDVVDGTIRPMILSILSSLVFVVLFIILSLIFSLVSGAVGKLATKIPVFGSVNAVLGGVLGLIKGVGLAAIGLIIVVILAKGSDNIKFREAAENSLGCSIAESVLPESML